jgi:hypothetical protein
MMRRVFKYEHLTINKQYANSASVADDRLYVALMQYEIVGHVARSSR